MAKIIKRRHYHNLYVSVHFSHVILNTLGVIEWINVYPAGNEALTYAKAKERIECSVQKMNVSCKILDSTLQSGLDRTT